MTTVDPITEYLDELANELGHLKPAEREAIIAEADDHLRSAAERLVADGVEPHGAAQLAVQRFGSAAAVGEGHRKPHPMVAALAVMVIAMSTVFAVGQVMGVIFFALVGTPGCADAARVGVPCPRPLGVRGSLHAVLVGIAPVAASLIATFAVLQRRQRYQLTPRARPARLARATCASLLTFLVSLLPPPFFLDGFTVLLGIPVSIAVTYLVLRGLEAPQRPVVSN